MPLGSGQGHLSADLLSDLQLVIEPHQVGNGGGHGSLRIVVRTEELGAGGALTLGNNVKYYI